MADDRNPRRRTPLFIGAALVTMGVLAIGAAASYYVIGLYGSSQLEDLHANVQGPVALPELPPESTQIRGARMPDGSFKPINTVVSAPATGSPTGVTPKSEAAGQVPTNRAALITPVRTVPREPERSNAGPVVPTAVVTGSVVAQPGAPHVPVPVVTSDTAPLDTEVLVTNYNTIYPGFEIHPKYWADPFWAGTDNYAYGEILQPDGFTVLSPSDGLPRGQGSQAREIRIPAIDVDSPIKDLKVIDLGDSRAYETPKNLVGRIPTTAQAWEVGNAWFFGHLESPIKGEGSVFKNLPKIPDMLRNGEPIYVNIVAEDGEYLYQVSETTVVHQDDLRLEDTDDATITLVACVPRLKYDHRILVTGKLVGVKRG